MSKINLVLDETQITILKGALQYYLDCGRDAPTSYPEIKIYVTEVIEKLLRELDKPRLRSVK